jgi:hypothetical protein
MTKSRRKRERGVYHVECIGEKRNAHKILVRTPERKRRFGKPIPRWENNIKVGLKPLERDSMDLIILLRIG